MKIDITLKITPKMVTDAQGNEKKALVGHLGTHFDVMNKEFPLEYKKRNGIVFDVSSVKNREIDIADIDMDKVKKDMFVCFYTGFIEEEGYGTKKYFTEHPELSNELLEALLQKKGFKQFPGKLRMFRKIFFCSIPFFLNKSGIKTYKHIICDMIHIDISNINISVFYSADIKYNSFSFCIFQWKFFVHNIKMCSQMPH